MMPKSTAAICPSLSTNRFPGCMSAWKKPSRSAWRRNVCISARPSAGRSSPRASSAARLESGVPSIHSSVRTVRAVRSQSTVGHAEIRIVLRVVANLGDGGGFEPQVHLDGDRTRERIDDLDEPQPARLGRMALGVARREIHRVEIGLEAPLDAGAQHLDGNAYVRRPPPCAPARSRRRRPPDRTRRRSRFSGLPSAAATAASASACGNGAILSCSDSRSRASTGPTTSGRVARNCPSLT